VKAVIVDTFGPFARARLREFPDPAAGPGEVVLDVAAADVNFADILVMEGRYQILPPLPFSPGKAAAGIVASAGPGVTGIAPGDRALVLVEYGAYAEKVKAPAGACFTLPADIPFETAAALGLACQTAHLALRDRARLREGESVLVLGGSGGVGVAAIQLARAFGARRVLAGVRGKDPENIAVAREAGADQIIDLTMDDLHNGLRAAVHAATDGAGVDVVIDPVGGAANAAALRALAWRGRLVIVGFAAGHIPVLRTNYLLVRNIEVSGLQWSDYRDRTPDLVRTAQGEIFAFCRDGRIAPHVGGTFALADFAHALSLLRDGAAQGKLVLLTGPR